MKCDEINETNVANDTFNNTKWLVLHKDGMIIMDEIEGIETQKWKLGCKWKEWMDLHLMGMIIEVNISTTRFLL